MPFQCYCYNISNLHSITGDNIALVFNTTVETRVGQHQEHQISRQTTLSVNADTLRYQLCDPEKVT